MGISFSVWLSQEGNGKQSRSGLELTPLNRNKKMKVLKNLPEFFDELLEADEPGGSQTFSIKIDTKRFNN